MCATCGCGASETTLTNLQTGEHADIGDQAHAHRQADGTWRDHDHGHDHRHAHDHDHHHHHGSDDHDHVDRDHQAEHSHPQADPQTTTIDLNARILAKNDRAAERNRAWFMGREVLALNLMSAPGAGKTTLLERTIADLKDRQKLFVLEGDKPPTTTVSASRPPARPRCRSTQEAAATWTPKWWLVAWLLEARRGSLLFIENVGNLVLPRAILSRRA